MMIRARDPAPPAGPGSVRLTVESALIGLAMGIAVVAPWTTGGYLLLLDWVSGPHQAVTPGLYGLDSSALDAMPFRIATQTVRHLVGARITGWLMILLYFPVAAAGAATLAGGGRWRRHPAALLMVCNPFVVERIHAGHVAFLLSVSLLTWLLASAVHARRVGKPFAARPAGWYALAMTVGPHGAWLGAVGLLAIALLPRPRLVDALRTGLIALSAGGVYLYGVMVVLTGIHTTWVTQRDLDAYAPRAGSGGLLATVASLHGFWRGGTRLPRDLLVPGAGPLLLVALLVAVVTGLVLLGRSDPVLGRPVAAITVVGLLLGAGVNGPAGAWYRAAFGAVPLFEAMREQQKWVALAMIGYAVAVGTTTEALVGLVRRAAGTGPRRLDTVRRILAATGVAVVCCGILGATPTLLCGLGGSVGTTRYPPAWAEADRIMGTGTGAVLFLPWHAYQPFDFTGGRAVATPASAYFRRPVLSGDAVELGELRTNSVSRRQAYVERLVAAAGAGGFGRLVAPLGVEYVAFARDREAEAYGWLERQPDLYPVLRTGELDLYRVTLTGTGRVVAARSAGYRDLFALVSAGGLGTEAVLGEGSTATPLPDGSRASGELPSAGSGRITRSGATRWLVGAGPPGWVVIPEEWSPGWRLAGRPGRPTAAGTVAFEVGAGPAVVEYTPWRWLRVGLAVSLASLFALLAAGLVEHRRELAGWWRAHRYWQRWRYRGAASGVRTHRSP